MTLQLLLRLLFLTLAVLPLAAEEAPAGEADLLGPALFAETNARRLQFGLPPLRPLAALQTAAEDHALDMAEQGYLSHISSLVGRETFLLRLEAVGITQGWRGENIAQGFALAYEEGLPFLPPSQTGEGFRYPQSETDLPWKSVEEAVRSLLDQWLASPPHRANILSEDYRFLGVAGVVVDVPEFENMPMIKAVQLFSSSPSKLDFED